MGAPAPGARPGRFPAAHPPPKKVSAGWRNTAGPPRWGKKSPWGMGEGRRRDAGEETTDGCGAGQRAQAPEPGGGGPAALGKQLIQAKLYTELDADTLGRYVAAQHQWELATGHAEEALEAADQEEADGWSRIQDRYFKQARACANDMGLTITSRCRLVVPGAGEPDEPENPFLQLIQGGASRRA